MNELALSIAPFNRYAISHDQNRCPRGSTCRRKAVDVQYLRQKPPCQPRTRRRLFSGAQLAFRLAEQTLEVLINGLSLRLRAISQDFRSLFVYLKYSAHLRLSNRGLR